MKSISIVIVTYFSINLIKDCIDSIFEFADIGSCEIEIIIVDNSPDEISCEMSQYLATLYGNRIKFIKNRENLGYGHGNNLGIEHSTSEIICIMNPDVRLIEPIFSDAISEFKKTHTLSMLGYKQIGGLDISFYLKPEYHFPIISLMLTKIANKYNIFNSKYFYLSGAFLFLSKKNFAKSGNFDENIFLFYEEPDVANRLLKNKFQIKYSKNHKYNHLVGDRNHWSETTFKYQIASLDYYLKKFGLSRNKHFRYKKMELFLKIFIYKLFLNKEKEKKARNEYVSIISFLNQ